MEVGNNPNHDEYTTTRAYLFGNYGDNLAHYLELADEARKDFPNLKNEEITVAVVNESTYMKNFVYIHFLVKNGLQKDGYEVWDEFDFR